MKRAVWLAVAASISMATMASGGRDMFGSLAYNSHSGAWGWSVDDPSQRHSNARALRQCGRGCQVVMEFRNTCGAFALGNRGGYGWAYADSQHQARNMAIRHCAKNDRGCSVKVWACTTR